MTQAVEAELSAGREADEAAAPAPPEQTPQTTTQAEEEVEDAMQLPDVLSTRGSASARSKDEL